ncbi:tape measure protein [Leucobacter sp. UT-8R-CII-1-4]|uniref:phage tail protein n=1 Tax=Leucobacter sp. UT-8R-CII-1-4 TaxID=3040075 RepID=UPI0024A8AA17|nr:tape measure protein [Leucobacter sp. UT-8R-CII-1-4]MDI6024461.1 tape measure protein [Leucobacter sp. UT-8R-CII-1-4]
MSEGVLYVEIMPSTKGIGKAVENDASAAFAGAEKTGTSFFKKIGGWAKAGALAVTGMVAAVGALAVGGGISRALNIEDAQAKLKGLGHDTQSVETIMKDALASVKGTAFGLDAAATTAAAAVASGIKPGQELEKYLRLTADAATIAGVSMEEMGSIINKVQAKGKAQMEDLNRLTERGIPIMQMLADEYGVTAEEMSKMVSRGEVDAERFRAALEKNLGGAALESGNTTRGALANLMASLSRLGLVFIGDGLDGAKTFFNEMTTIFDGIAERIGPVVDWVQEKLGGMFQIEGMGERFLSFIDSLNIGDVIGQAFSNKGSMVEAGLGIATSLIEGMIAGVPQIVESATGLVEQIVGALQQHAPALIAGAATLFLGLATGLLEALPGIVESVLGLIPMLLTALIGMLPALIEGGVQLFMGLVQSLSTVLPQIINALVEAIPQIIDAIVTAIPLVVAALANALPQIIDGALQLFLGLVLGIAQAIPEIVTAVVGLIPVLITTLIGMIPVLVEGAVQLFTGLLQALPVILPQLITGIFDTLLAVVGALVESIPLILDAAITLFTSLIEAIPVILPDLIMALIGMIPVIVQALIGLVSTLVSAAVQLFMGLVIGLGTVLPKLFHKLGEVWPGIWNSIKAIPGKMADFGKNIIQGLIDGVSSMVSNAVNAVQDVGGKMLDGVKSFLGIHSPSRVFRDQVGKMVGLGLLAGIEDQAISARIDTAVDHLVSVPGEGAQAAAAGVQVVVQGNVYGDPDHVGEVITHKARRAQAAYGTRNIK